MLLKVCNQKEIAEDGVLYKFEVNEKRLFVVRLSGVYHAADSTCTHEEADLSLGILNDEVLLCPLHQAKFDIRSGKVISGPSGDDPGTISSLRTYETKVENNELYIVS